MPLTDTALRAVKATKKAQKLFDGNGLFLFVAPSAPKAGDSSTASKEKKNF